MNANPLTTVGLMLTLASLVGSFFNIQLSQWLRDLLALAQKGKIQHTIKRIEFKDVNENLELLRAGDIIGRAVIVFDDVELDSAVTGIASAAYFNAGQDCTAATRVLVQRGIHDEFVAALTQHVRGGVRTGAPSEADAHFVRKDHPSSK